LFFEFVATIKLIEGIISCLRSSFNNVNLVLENIGLLLRVNITSDSLTCGQLFSLIERSKEELGISYYSITMAKMETLFRNIVEDESNNSLNDCTILFYKQAGIDEKEKIGANIGIKDRDQ